MPTKYSHLTGKELVEKMNLILEQEESVLDMTRYDRGMFGATYIDRAMKGDTDILMHYITMMCGEPE